MFTAYFVVGIGAGMYLLNRKRRSIDVPCQVPPQNVRKERGHSKQVAAGRRRAKT